jgi:C-terminal processing protease CtpA/Prc
MTPVDLLQQQQLSLQRQLESLQQEGRDQMVTLQKSLGVDVLQQQQNSVTLQQNPAALRQQQQNISSTTVPRKELSQSASDVGAQTATGNIRSDPSTVPNNSQQPQTTLPIKLFGVGIFFATDANGGQVVRSFVPGGPAERSGQVAIGDVIVSVDNTDVYGLPLATLAKYLLGPRGSTINMGFCKPHDKTVRGTKIRSPNASLFLLHCCSHLYAGTHQSRADNSWC